MTIDYQKLGKRIKEERQKKGMTQDQLSQLVNCNSSHISNIELARTVPSLDLLYSIADVLDVGIDALFMDQFKNPLSAQSIALAKAFTRFSESKRNLVLLFIEFLSNYENSGINIEDAFTPKSKR